jgi:DNA-directed RNA polymerase subunit RPC12/RpoP
MKEKMYKCTVCEETFTFGKSDTAAMIRREITEHCWDHACDGENANVLATNYRANYTCITCGKVFNIGPKGIEAMQKRIDEHRKTCLCGAVIPNEFITEAEETSWLED